MRYGGCTDVGAQVDRARAVTDREALLARIAALEARVAALEANPSVPAQGRPYTMNWCAVCGVYYTPGTVHSCGLCNG